MQSDPSMDINPDQLTGNITSQESLVFTPDSPLTENFIAQVQREADADSTTPAFSFAAPHEGSVAAQSPIASSVNPLDSSPKIVGGGGQVTLPRSTPSDIPPAGLTGLNNADYSKKI